MKGNFILFLSRVLSSVEGASFSSFSFSVCLSAALSPTCLSLPGVGGSAGVWRSGGRRHPGRAGALGQGDGQEASGWILPGRASDGLHGPDPEEPTHRCRDQRAA